MPQNESVQKAKKAAGYAAIDFVHPDMVIGLGTGSTAFYFIEKLIEKCRQGLKVKAVATSITSQKQATAGNIPIIDINSITTLDLTVDGADEIDQQKRMIKGGGGALLREKIVAAMSKEMIVIVDQSKVVSLLGHFPLPVEILPFAHHATMAHIEKLGYTPIIRKTSEGKIFTTDNGNYICDIHFNNLLQNPEHDNALLNEIPGILETGFFFHLAKKVIVGYENGHIEIKK
jgi:ribose 5-phosphate isomerase A